MPDVPIAPDTLDELQSSILECFGALAKGARSSIKLIRAPESVRLLVVPQSKADVKLEVKDQHVLIQVKKRLLVMYLGKFLVTTGYAGQKLFLNIETAGKSPHRVLHSALREVSETRHPVFVSRLLRVVRNLEEDLPDTRIDEASAARSDFEVFLDAMSASPNITNLISGDPLAAAKFRGLKRKKEILERAGGTFRSAEVAETIGISRQAVDKRRAANQLLALTQGKRGYVYPRFQFEDGTTLPGLEEVLFQLKNLDPWMQLIFFATPNERLDGATPIEALGRDDSKLVLEAARGYGEQGAA
jgi:hypothetical protein